MRRTLIYVMLGVAVLLSGTLLARNEQAAEEWRPAPLFNDRRWKAIETTCESPLAYPKYMVSGRKTDRFCDLGPHGKTER